MLFLSQCSLAFSQSLHSFPDDGSKLSFVISLLKGRALAWAEAFFSFLPAVFLNELRKSFTHPVFEGSSAKKWLNFHQSDRSVVDFPKTWQKVLAWKCAAGGFLQALNDQSKDQLVSRDEPASFEELISLTFHNWHTDGREGGREKL